MTLLMLKAEGLTEKIAVNKKIASPELCVAGEAKGEFSGEKCLIKKFDKKFGAIKLRGRRTKN